MEYNSKKDSKNENIKNNPNKTIDPIFNQIQEILIDQEMCQKKLLDKNDNNYILELTIPGKLILKNFNVFFLLIIPKNYPKQEPELYCKTIFSHPHLCDGRNLINNIINREWTYDDLPLEFIINKIPKFIIKYDEYMVITIGDISLCIYELEKGNNFKFCKLTFFINIKEIIEIITKSANNLIIIKYKSEKTIKKINISSQDYITIENILKEKMKLYKKKEGKLPDIDIKYLENEIEEKEKELLNKENEENTNKIYMYKEKCLRLMDLYQQAVEFYSAVNNPRYKDINIKIQKLIENIKLTSNLDKKEDEQKKEENINKKKQLNENIKESKDINKNDNKNEKEELKENEIEKKIKENNKENNKDNLDKKEKGNVNEKKEIKREVKNKEKEEEKKEGKKEEIKIEKKENNKNENKDKNTKKIENNETSLRLKIDEGQLNTLDFGEEEEEEEEDGNN